MLGKSQFIFFTCQKLILAHFYKLSYKDRDLWWPNKYRVACFSHSIPAKVKKILRKSQPQIREKLKTLSLRKKAFFLQKKGVLYYILIYSGAEMYLHFFQCILILKNMEIQLIDVSQIYFSLLGCIWLTGIAIKLLDQIILCLHSKFSSALLFCWQE